MSEQDDFYLTREDAVRFINEAVQERGADYVYNDHFGSCEYVSPRGEPRCLVGEVLVRAGLDPSYFQTFDGEPSAYRNGLGVQELGLNMEPEVREALSYAQEWQDGGKPWGEALEAFNDALGLNVERE